MSQPARCVHGGFSGPGLAGERSARLQTMDFCLPLGFFFEPTVFTDVEDHMFIAKEESFGPIMIISRFADG